MKLRIVVADDNQKALLFMVKALSLEFEIIATAADGQSALDQIRRCQPSVVVLDVNMPKLNGIEVTREIVRQGLSSGVILCSVENDPEVIEAAQRAGALGYVFKARVNQDLSAAVKLVANGAPFVSGS
jgi:two-component system response regulator DegU